MIETEQRTFSHRLITPEKMDEFRQLYNRWQHDLLSRQAPQVDHPAFQRIVAMGEPAVPLILEELKEKPSWLFLALEQITGENPVEETGADNLEEINLSWIGWGEKRRYIKRSSLELGRY